MTQAIIVFLKPLVPGRVKTRLAKDIGDYKACSIYNKLIEHTAKVLNQSQTAIFLFYDEVHDFTQQYFTGKNQVCLQEGADLGERMKHAFEIVFNKGFKQAIIIGTDCAELNANIIVQAFDALSKYDVVIGPATDGGYYLLGLKEMQYDLFTNISWSTPFVLTQTKSILQQNNLSYHELSMLSDIDTLQDILRLPETIKQEYEI